MKICISSQGREIDSQLDPRFGRARYFIFLNEKGEIEEVVENPAVSAPRGAGIMAAQIVVSKGANLLITGNIGPHAFPALTASGIEVFLAPPTLTVKEAFSQWKEGKLSKIDFPPAPGGGCGFGGGFRWRFRRGWGWRGR